MQTGFLKRSVSWMLTLIMLVQLIPVDIFAANYYVWDEEGNALPNATVTITWTDWWGRQQTSTPELNNRGRFTFSPGAYTYSITVTCDGYEPYTNSNWRGGNITLSPIGTQTTAVITVKDSYGNLLPGAAVSILRNGTTVATGTTNFEGIASITFNRGSTGTYTVTASKDHYDSANGTLPASNTQTLVLTGKDLPVADNDTVVLALYTKDGEFPGEPAAHDSGDYLEINTDFSTGTRGAFWSDDILNYDQVMPDMILGDGAWGIFSAEGLEDKYFTASFREQLEQHKIGLAMDAKEHSGSPITEEEAANYKIIWYVVKWQWDWGGEWHINGIVVDKESTPSSTTATAPPATCPPVPRT